MFVRRVLIVGGILLVLFLAMYSWNRRTGVLDDVAANVGLELSSWALGPWRILQDVGSDFWNRYFDLVDVREENLRLKSRVDELEALLVSKGEDLAELERLRKLVQFPVDVRWRTLAARVLAGRMGPNAVLDSITISRGYANGAKPGMPLVTNMGLVGRVLRSSAHASIALLIIDPGSRIAVFGQESRAAGILKGQGIGRQLEVDFVRRNAGMKAGEVLVTSGLDDKYPRGLPVARVASIAPSDYTQFMTVYADPLVDLQRIEEVLLLEKSGIDLPEEEKPAPGVFVGPPLPEHLQKIKSSEKQSPRRANPQASAGENPQNGAQTQNGQPARLPGQDGEANRPEAARDNGEAPRFRVIIP